MKTLQKIVGGLAMIVMLSGCCSENSENIQNTKYETIKGQPLAVNSQIAYGHLRRFAAVINVNGKPVFAGADVHPTESTDLFGSRSIDAATLVESEINDGDNGKIELQGHYNGNIFEVQSVKANGYTVNF